MRYKVLLAWFTDGELLNTTIANWMANNLGDVIDGTLDLDEAFIDLAANDNTKITLKRMVA